MTWSMWSVNRNSVSDADVPAPAFAARFTATLEPARGLVNLRPMQDTQSNIRGGIPVTSAPGQTFEHGALLLRVARQQDRAAFAELFGYYGPRVKSYLARLGADAASAEDLMQDVMLVVWRRATEERTNPRA